MLLSEQQRPGPVLKGRDRRGSNPGVRSSWPPGGPAPFPAPRFLQAFPERFPGLPWGFPALELQPLPAEEERLGPGSPAAPR